MDGEGRLSGFGVLGGAGPRAAHPKAAQSPLSLDSSPPPATRNRTRTHRRAGAGGKGIARQLAGWMSMPRTWVSRRGVHWRCSETA